MMRGLRTVLSAELRKVISTRAFLGLAIALVVILMLLVALVVNLPSSDNIRINGVPGNQKVRLLFAQAGTVSLFALIAGIVVSTTDFRYGTIVPSLLANPSRSALMAAKAAVGAALGLGLGLLAVLVIVGIGLPWLSQMGPVTVPGEAWERIAREAAAAPLWGALGVAIGMLVRNQVVAIVGAVAWTLVVENLVSNLRPSVSRWLLFGLDGSITGRAGGDVLVWWVALTLFVAYITAAATAGAVRLARSDV